MTNKELEAILDMPVAQRFEEWKKLRQQWVNGYDKIDLRLAQRMDDDFAELLTERDVLTAKAVAARQEGFEKGVRECIDVLNRVEVVGQGDDDDRHVLWGDVYDGLCTLLPKQPQVSVSLPDFKSVDAGGFQ